MRPTGAVGAGRLLIRRAGLLGREGRAIDGVRRRERERGASPLEGRVVGRWVESARVSGVVRVMCGGVYFERGWEGRTA